jgi:hypothetical protein
MPINGGGGNGFPLPMIDVMEQKLFLERKIREAMLPSYVFRPKNVSADDWFDANIGETKTFTARALIAPNINPLNPALNTGLDNGMTADVRSFEQWTATLNRWPGFLPTFVTGDTALIASVYLDNIYAIGQKAGNSLELVCANRLWQAYDSGDTFALAGATSTSFHADNCNGFLAQFPSADLPNYKTPSAVSSSNPINVAIVSNSTGDILSLTTVTAVSLDSPSQSYMVGGNQVFGQSGTLTLAASETWSTGDRIVALDPGASLAANPPTVGSPLNPVFKDGSFVVRPLNGSGNMITTAYAMASTNILNPTQMFPYAASILKRRGVPKLANGLYGCAIDSTLLAQVYQDQGFERATATRWHSSPVFQDGVIAAGWGLEFTEATQVPTYAAPAAAGQFQLRHGLVFGQDVIAEHPFKGAKEASSIVAGIGDVADTRWVDRIKFRTLAAIDTLGDVVKMAYDYQGDFVPRTDKSSNPTIILSSDYMRYKRGVMIQCASAF